MSEMQRTAHPEVLGFTAAHTAHFEAQTQKSIKNIFFLNKWIPAFTIFIQLLLLSYSSASELSCKDGICENKGFGILTLHSLLELILKAVEAEWKRKGNSGKW